jgi:hypothetical protein
MARMLELIREGAAPRSMMRRAARGELTLPPDEAIEVLMTLSEDRELGAEAEQTLATWEESSLSAVASNPGTAPELLRYLLRNQAQRPAVMASLCGNPALPLEELESLASHGKPETLKGMLRCERVRNSSLLLELIMENPFAEPLRPQLAEWLARAEGSEAEAVEANILEIHSDELVCEDAQPFELVAALEGEEDPLAQLLTRAKQGEPVVEPQEQAQLSILQRIGQMRVGERIKLAVRGNREERMVLIRDRSKLVSLAVLASPKVNETEMEAFAAMKNIQESVLRAIAANRKNLKRYGVVKTLASNPKTPLDVALPLLSHLLIKDLRALAMNKNVNETVRKIALKFFRAKTERKRD